MIRKSILVASIFFTQGCSTGNEGNDEIQVDVSVTEENNLHFTLSNNSASEITLGDWQVPWAVTYPFATIISVHSVESETRRLRSIEESIVLVSGVLEPLSISPGEEIDGVVMLEDRFPELTTNRFPSYFVYWTYNLNLCAMELSIVNNGLAIATDSDLDIVFQRTDQGPVALACRDAGGK